jgi:hypothetical protein
MTLLAELIALRAEIAALLEADQNILFGSIDHPEEKMTESYIHQAMKTTDHPTSRDALYEVRRLIAELYEPDERDFELLIVVESGAHKSPVLTAGRTPYTEWITVDQPSKISWRLKCASERTVYFIDSDGFLVSAHRHKTGVSTGQIALAGGQLKVGVE